MSVASTERSPTAEGAVVAKAVLNAADRLGIANRTLAGILGISEASVSRMARGTYIPAPTDKAFELGVLFVRLFRSLDSITGGDEVVARSWLRNDNIVLGAPPLKRIATIAGLFDVIAYLDARRAIG